MRVRLYRPTYQRRARCLLAIALLLPGAGFVQAGGLNPVSIGASGVLVAAAILVVIMALRPVAVVLRSGILIMGSPSQPATSIGWGEIVRIESEAGVTGVTTRGKMLYQLALDARGERFVSRMVEHTLSARGV